MLDGVFDRLADLDAATLSASARAGQGAGNALLHARLGIEAIRQCRPLPFMAEEPPRLANVRKALFDRDGELR